MLGFAVTTANFEESGGERVRRHSYSIIGCRGLQKTEDRREQGMGGFAVIPLHLAGRVLGAGGGAWKCIPPPPVVLDSWTE